MPEIQSAAGNGTPRIGVYVCHCGTNIAATVDVEAVKDFAAGLPDIRLQAQPAAQ